MNRTFVTLTLLLVACGSGEWTVTTWGEDYIEQGIPASEFADGCSVTFDAFEVEILQAALVDGNDEVVADVPATAFDLTTAGPQTVGTVDAPARLFDTARFRIGPADGPSVRAAGQLTCADATVSFDWTFQTDTTYDCEPDDLVVPSGGVAETEFTIHGDHLFYDGLDNPDAELRGQAWIDADGNADGTLTLEELSAVSVAGLGYEVGPYSEVEDLAAFVTHLTRTVGHVNGEGHCRVDL